ncbi:MAG: Type II secretion system F domain protein, partial [Synergistales bacterium 53_16]
MIYRYRARNADGKAINGVISAYSQEQVVQQLRGQGLVPIAITQDQETEKESLLEKM